MMVKDIIVLVIVPCDHLVDSMGAGDSYIAGFLTRNCRWTFYRRGNGKRCSKCNRNIKVFWSMVTKK